MAGGTCVVCKQIIADPNWVGKQRMCATCYSLTRSTHENLMNILSADWPVRNYLIKGICKALAKRMQKRSYRFFRHWFSMPEKYYTGCFFGDLSRTSLDDHLKTILKHSTQIPGQRPLDLHFIDNEEELNCEVYALSIEERPSYKKKLDVRCIFKLNPKPIAGVVQKPIYFYDQTHMKARCDCCDHPTIVQRDTVYSRTLDALLFSRFTDQELSEMYQKLFA